MNTERTGSVLGADTRTTREWMVTDPARVADGYYGKTFHKSLRAAKRRVEMFPGSVIERIR